MFTDMPNPQRWWSTDTQVCYLQCISNLGSTAVYMWLTCGTNKKGTAHNTFYCKAQLQSLSASDPIFCKVTDKSKEISAPLRNLDPCSRTDPLHMPTYSSVGDSLHYN